MMNGESSLEVLIGIAALAVVLMAAAIVLALAAARPIRSCNPGGNGTGLLPGGARTTTPTSHSATSAMI